MRTRISMVTAVAALMSCGQEAALDPLSYGGKSEKGIQDLAPLELSPLDSKVLSLPCSGAMGCEVKANICITPYTPLQGGWALGVRFDREPVANMEYTKTIFWNQPQSGTSCLAYEKGLLADFDKSLGHLRISSRASVPMKVELRDFVIADRQTCWSPNGAVDQGPKNTITFETRRKKLTFYTDVYDDNFRPGDSSRASAFLAGPQDARWYTVKVQPTTSPPLVTVTLKERPSDAVYLVEMTYTCRDGSPSKLQCIDGEPSANGGCSSTERVIALPDCATGGQALLRVSSTKWPRICKSFSVWVAVN